MQFWFADMKEELNEHGECFKERTKWGELVIICMKHAGVGLNKYFFESVCIIKEVRVIAL
jgi:hypothetical protein